MFKKLTISKQILFTVIGLILIAFTLTATLAYIGASRILLENELHAQESEVDALAKSLSGRFASVKEIAHSQVRSLRMNQFSELTVGSGVDTIAGLDFPQLLQQGQPVLEQNQIMDRFFEATGSHATLFAYHRGDFVRVITSLRKENGSRAIGTKLGKQHPGYSALMEGNDFSNMVELFGKRYLSYYHPIKDERRNIIGILFIGLPMKSVIADITQSLKDITWGKTGYSILLDATEEKQGNFLYHPATRLIGTSIKDVSAADGSKPFIDIFEQNKGVVRYLWETEGIVGEKFLVYSHVPGWNWMLMGGTHIFEITEGTKKLLVELIVISTISAALIIFLLTWLLRRILQPLQRLTEQVDAFGQGHISQSIENVDETSNNEIHRLATSLANMGTNLQNLINDLRNSGNELSTTADTLNATANQSCLDLEEMGQQTNQLASAIEEMNASAASVAEQASTIATEMHSAKKEADRSDEEVVQMLTGMAELGDNLKQSSTAIEEVAQQGRNIENVTRLIDEIAEQTNLLALNAAIEAARAGEQGRGFAVVADEVRQLAHRTQQSVKDVVEIITQLQSSTESAVGLMQKSQTMGEDVSLRAQETGSALEGIIEQINTIATMSDSIATTAEQQAQVSHELAEGVTLVRDLSSSNLEGANNTVNDAKAVNQESETLNRQVGYFH